MESLAGRGTFHLMRWLIGLVALCGCQGSGSPVTFAGTAEEPLTTPDHIIEVGSNQGPPEGYRLIGVVTARCGALDGSGGLLGVRCTIGSMTEHAKAKAAAVGGTAVMDLRCGETLVDRLLDYRDGGVETQTRTAIECQASVLRAAGGMPAPPAAQTGSATTVEVAGVAVNVSSQSGAAPAGKSRPPTAVGELATSPADSVIARLDARCATSCSSSTPRRALKQIAGRLGALAIAEVNCTPEGELWRCQASAVGPSEAASDTITDAGA